MIPEKSLEHRIQTSMHFDGIPEIITTDERMLKQIIYNLLSNAVKFTSDGGKISLQGKKCDLSKKDCQSANVESQPGIEISIADSGIGIKPEDIDRIFQPFEQLDSSAGRRYQGTGLGLSLTKRLVGLLGGKIWAESEGEGKGTIFRFTIPLS